MELNSEVSTSTDEYKDCQEEGAHAYVARSYLLTCPCTVLDVLYVLSQGSSAQQQIKLQKRVTPKVMDKMQILTVPVMKCSYHHQQRSHMVAWVTSLMIVE